MTRLYLDTSALVKLMRHEPETESLTALLERFPDTPVASALVRVELRQAAARAGDRAGVARAEAILGETDLIALDDPLLDAAGHLDASGLRSLDAIHVASARLLGSELEALVTYDRRMFHAAEGLGLPVAAPGILDPG